MVMQIASAKQRLPRWTTFAGLAIVHLGALCAFIPGTFHWSALVVMVVLYYTTGAWGICLGYHRLLTHRSLKLAKPLEYAAAILGTLALQGGPIDWIATHRAHHAHTDKEGDPHDIHRGLMWSHFEWLYKPNDAMLSPAEQVRLAPDLANDKFYQFLEKSYLWWTVALAVVLFAVGGWSWLVWGVFVRIVITYHITWLVNSAAHHSGYQSFRTGDKSTNNWWVAFLAWGEGWHNNHHAFPFSARHGLRWFEIDFTWWTIKVLAWMKLARDVKLPTPQMMQRMQLQPQRAQSDRA
jgi:sn-1 stearoyl-lipid 9-desaturase